MFYLADTPQKVDKIHRAVCFTYSCISSIQFKLEVQLFRLRVAVKAIFQFTFAQATSFPSKYIIDQPRFKSNAPSNRWYIARIFQIWQAPVGYEN